MKLAGPIARTVGDARLMFESLAQRSGARIDRPNRARILVVEKFGDAPVDPEIVARTRDAAANLAALGHTIAFGALPFSIDVPMAAWQAITNYGFAELSRSEPEFFEKASPGLYIYPSPTAGQKISAEKYADLIETVLRFRALVGKTFEAADIINDAGYSGATLARGSGAAIPRESPAGKSGPRGHAVFTAWVNASCGHPAISIPCRPCRRGRHANRYSIRGAAGADEFLLDVA